MAKRLVSDERRAYWLVPNVDFLVSYHWGAYWFLIYGESAGFKPMVVLLVSDLW